MRSSNQSRPQRSALALVAVLAALGGCTSGPVPGIAASANQPPTVSKPTNSAPIARAVTAAPAAAAEAARPITMPPVAAATAAAPGLVKRPVKAHASDLPPPDPVRFEDAIARAGQSLFANAIDQLGTEPRALVVDPLIDANTGGQTVSTAQMGVQLESIAKSSNARWSVAPLTRESLAARPLLLIGTLTPVNIERSVDKVPDAFRVWLTLIDLRTGKVVAKEIDRATVDSVNPEPLRYYRDSPTWHKDKTVLGYINSCQVNTNIGDPADPDYLARLPAAAVVNEAILAYDEGKIPAANKLYKEAEPIAEPGDLRVLNGLYLTNWQLGRKSEAGENFGKLVASGLELKRLPVKLLFQPGKTSFNQIGDLPQQYQLWLTTLAEQTDHAKTCIRIVGHTSRTGSARGNEILSRRRAEEIQKMIEKENRALRTRLSSTGVGSREALVGLGTDDMRDALDRRVEFRVVDCV
ncbi:MAG: OmpA family protein [Ideonella sp.]